jgi:hypothetical protein
MQGGHEQGQYYQTRHAGTDQAAPSAWLLVGLRIGSTGQLVG